MVRLFPSEGAVDNCRFVGLILLCCVCYVPIHQAMVNDIQMKPTLVQPGLGWGGGGRRSVCVRMQCSRCKQ